VHGVFWRVFGAELRTRPRRSLLKTPLLLLTKAFITHRSLRIPPAIFLLKMIRVVSNDKDGTFAFRGLAPGRYKAVALTGDDRKRDHDFAILGDKLNATSAFEVVAGQSLSVNVRPF
jgi:hypothetical protein